MLLLTEIILLVILAVLIMFNTVVMVKSVIYIPRKEKCQKVLTIAKSIVLEAERLWGEDLEEVKKAHVKAKLYLIITGIPYLRRFALENKTMDTIVEEAFNSITGYLKDNPLIAETIHRYSANPTNKDYK